MKKQKVEYDSVALEKGLEPCEVETGFYFNRSMDGKAIINTNDPQVMVRLMNCPFFEAENWRTEKQGRKDILTYVDGVLPIGAINIGKPRTSNSISKLVKAPRTVYTAKEKEENKRKMAERLNGKAKKGKT